MGKGNLEKLEKIFNKNNLKSEFYVLDQTRTRIIISFKLPHDNIYICGATITRQLHVHEASHVHHHRNYCK
jgi:hypothetical protein